MLIIKFLDLVKSTRAFYLDLVRSTRALMLRPTERWLRCLLVGLWANYITSLRCNVFSYKMGNGNSAGRIKCDNAHN